MANKQYAVGIDVGGTKMLAGVVEVGTGTVLGTARKRTRPERGVEFFKERLLTVVREALDATTLPPGGTLSAIGIGVAGQVDRTNGVLLAAPNLSSGLDHLPLADLLRERFQLPAAVGNDV